MTAETITTLVGSSEDGLLAFGQKGLLLRRTAASSTWQVTPAKPLAGGAGAVAASLVPASTEIWAAGTQGVLMRRIGTEWLAEPTLTLQPYYGISAASSSDVFVVGANGLILHRY